MKLVSFQLSTPLGVVERIGAVDESGSIIDLEWWYRQRLVESGTSESMARQISEALLPASMVRFIEGGEASMTAARQALDWAAERDAEPTRGRHAPGEVTLLAPVPHPPLLRDFMAFESHLKNIYPTLGREIPPEWYEFPVYYKGNPAAFGANGQDITVPSYEAQLDFEFELAVVIGKGGTDISRECALDHVFGMMIYNDFSARVFQAREMAVGLGPAKGKDFQYGHVFGPWLVTIDEIPDPYDLKMLARVNDEVWCDDNSGSIHWKIEDMIAHASRDEMVQPGEIFGTGTVGWGSAAERRTALNSGDVIELEVEHLGMLRNRVV